LRTLQQDITQAAAENQRAQRMHAGISPHLSLHSYKQSLIYKESTCGCIILNTQKSDAYVAIADPTRRKILTLLAARETSVNDLVHSFDISQPAISQHLKILRSAGIVDVRKDGRRRLYRVDFHRLKAVHDWISQFESYWNEKLDSLETYLQQNEEE
jgi:DNA-binding transcriptional ArsR family regulator